MQQFMGVNLKKIVIVGGGVGGLELATKLGRSLGKKNKAKIILIDKCRVHFWKPHLHELAAGTLAAESHSVDYLAQAYNNHFSFYNGNLISLNREQKKITLEEFRDDRGDLVTPECEIDYDDLVLAIGSQINDFSTPGVDDFAVALDSVFQAQEFQKRMINSFLRANAQLNQNKKLMPEQLKLVVVGGGATGVELAAELFNATRSLVTYGFGAINPDSQIEITVLEANSRILKGLPEKISKAVKEKLSLMKINVVENAKVSKVLPNSVLLSTGNELPAEIVVWAAGVKCSSFLKKFGLETSENNQLLVKPTLQTTLDDSIFALGDCAAVSWLGGEATFVPPRAQAANQQAKHLTRQFIKREYYGKMPSAWTYHDFGSLVSLGKFSPVASLMSNFTGKSMYLEGFFSRLMYWSLYKSHEIALYGYWKTAVLTLSRFFSADDRNRVKLH